MSHFGLLAGEYPIDAFPGDSFHFQQNLGWREIQPELVP